MLPRNSSARLTPGGFQESLERVLQLQPKWSAANTPDMEERGNLIRDTIPNALARLVASIPEQQPFGLEVQGKDGAGMKSRVPWDRVYSSAHSRKPTSGWYVVYLFAYDGSAVFLSLNQGTQITKKNGGLEQQPSGEIRGRARWARKFLADQIGNIDDLSSTIQLKDTGKLGGGYELGNVCALRYERGNVPGEGELRRDLGNMLDLLNLIYSNETQADSKVPEVPEQPQVPQPAAQQFGGDDMKDEAPHLPEFDLALVKSIAKERGFLFPDSVYAQIIAVITSGKHLILTGPPGTGKTSLGEIVAEAARRSGMCSGYLPTTATSDWTTFDTIGGLQPTESGNLEFSEGLFLQAIRSGNWLLIDELNRAKLDRAFGQLFTVLSGQTVILPYKQPGTSKPIALVPSGSHSPEASIDAIDVPSDWRIIATMNVFDKTLLFEMSYALMRRFAFVEVPAPEKQTLINLIIREANQNEEAVSVVRRLMGLGDLKPFGAAIYMDAVRYADRRISAGNVSDDDVAFECFYSFFLPQFEGIDDAKGKKLYNSVLSVVGKNNAERLRSTLIEVLGLESLVLVQEEIDPQEEDTE